MILLDKVTKIYKMGEMEVKALDGIHFSMDEGDFVAVMGASGSGKSTMMNILGCLDIPTGGEYFLDDKPVSRMKKEELAHLRNHKLGFIFQSFNLLSRTTALDNVELPLFYGKHIKRKERHEKALKALDLVGLSSRHRHFPNQLSGGQQQRVAIARALVTNPLVILADEPTGNLDSTTSQEIMSLFTDLNKMGKTILLVTHEHDISQWAKRKIVLKDGRIISDTLNGETDKQK
ncbi:ABC transporter ATP-binding protein [candidate division WOR-3 bacterium]|nr:ABC transporter ATP-binding protein [candidate division WOR-3 bacterium]